MSENAQKELNEVYMTGLIVGMSLGLAIHEAGGHVEGMEQRFRDGMTVDEFMEKFAHTNGIVRDGERFKFVPQEYA